MVRLKNPDTTRTRLLEVGLALFAKRGYHGTGIKEIVDTAKVPKGSFYSYFKSKEGFGIEIVKWHSDAFWQKWHDSMDAQAPDPLQALSHCFDNMLTNHRELAVDTFSVVAHVAAEVCETSVECRSTMKTIFDQMCGAIADHISRAQELGLARGDMEADKLANLFWDGWQGSILRMKIENSIEPVRHCVAMFFCHILKN